MPLVCCVPGCNNNVKNGVSFHRFPKKNAALRDKWVRFVNERSPVSDNNSVWRPNNFHRICGAHFNKSCKKQHFDNIPKYWNKKNEKADSTQDPVKMCYFTEDAQIEEVIVGTVSEDVKVILQNVCPKESEERINSEPFKDQNDHKCYLENEPCASLKKSLETALREINEKDVEIARLQKELSDLKQDLQKKTIKLSALQHDVKVLKSMKNEETGLDTDNWDAKRLQFYTAFSSKELYQNFANLIYPEYCRRRKLGASKKLKANDSSYVLGFNQQLLLVLMRLRLGLLEQDLAYRFEISQASVSRICIFWIDLLASYLSQVPIWPSKELIQNYMPNKFKLLYPNTRVIIDCTEIFIEKPSDCNVQSVTYSSYKHHNTAKGLVGITPNGFISFVSDLFPGRKSDKEIVIASGFLELIEPGDHVMADRGFLIGEELEGKGATLNMPPFSRGGLPFTEDEDCRTKQIAALRVHVERLIRLIKTFRIVKFIFPNTMSSQLSSVWKICCLLVNFVNEPLLDR